MQNLMSLIAILAIVAIVHSQTNGVNLVSTPLEKYIYLNPTSSPTGTPVTTPITFSDGIYVRDTFSNTPIACNGDWQKADVQIYKKGTCFNIPPSTTPSAQANTICNFAYTVTNLQTSYTSANPTFVADSNVVVSSSQPPVYNYVNLPSAGCSYQLILDVANCAQTLFLPYYGQSCQTTVGNYQYQTTLISGNAGAYTATGSTSTYAPFNIWYYGPTGSGTSVVKYNCATMNAANLNKLNFLPLATPGSISGTWTPPTTGTSTLYQCGAPMGLDPAPIGTASECQNGIPGCICVGGISSRCMYSLDMLTGGSPYNLLVMSSWNNNLGLGCTGNMTEAQVVATGTCLSANHLTPTNPRTIKINGNVLNRPYVKATVATGGQQYNLNFYHTETNCLADSNAVETFVGQMGTCLTEDDHPSDDTATLAAAKQLGYTASKYNNIFYGPNNVVGMTNRILVNYYPASYNCNGDDDDNYCTITSGGVAGIVIAVVFVVFLLLVILFMCIRYCGKAPATSGGAPTVTTQSKGGEGNPLLSGSV